MKPKKKTTGSLELPPPDPELGVPVADTELDPATLTLTWTGVGALATTEPCRLYDEGIERAIVKHRIPTREGDVIQDMGSYAQEYNLEGLCTAGERTTLDSMAALVQVDASGHGIGALTITNDAGSTIISLTYLAIEGLSKKYAGGFPQRFSYILKLVKTL